MTVFADGGWARAVGVIRLFACAISTFGLITAEPDRKISSMKASQSSANRVHRR